jgi:hypothetical protein
MAGSKQAAQQRSNPEALEFARGLYPILLEGDVAAFRRYLGRWEDVIGDTAEMVEVPPDQQRRTMTAILRRPRQFNLPPWEVVLGGGGVEEPLRSDAAGPATAPAASLPDTTETSAVEVATDWAEDRLPSSGVYQLDMLTGELVPVVCQPALVHGATKGAVPDRPKRRRAPRRVELAGLEQLLLWPELR